MADVPVVAVVAAFNSENGAQEAQKELDQAKSSGMIKIKESAILRRDANNELKIHDSGDGGAGRGALIGGIGGAVLGVVTGPVGWVTLGGVAIGALTGKLRDTGFKDERLKQIGESLKPNTSALIAIVEEEWVREVEQRIRQLAADVVTETISADIATQLEMEADQMKQSETKMAPGPQAVPPQPPSPSDSTDTSQQRAA